MVDNKIKIGVITSSASMASHVRQLQYSPDFELSLNVKGLDEAIPIGKRMEQQGMEVIVSHTGTSNLLQEHLKIPVISVPHSSLDLLSAMQKAVMIGKRILIPNFQEELSNIEIIRQLFPVEIIQGIYSDLATLSNLIRRSRKKGCNVVIGGGIGVALAQRHGMMGVEITASPEAIKTTIDSAVSVALANRKEKARMQRLYNIIDAVTEGIVSVDQDGVIMTVNQQARQILNLGNSDITGNDFRDRLPWGRFHHVLETQSPIVDQIESINSQLYILNYSPVFLESKVVGCIATFQDAAKVIRSENEVRRSLTKGLVAKYTVNDLIWSSPAMGKIIDTINKFAPTDCTVLITGETGTGKEIIAQGIHNLSQRKSNAFVSINCAALPEQLLESELFGYEGGAFTGSKKSGKPGLFEMAHNGTILLDEISATSLKVQSLMLRVLQEREVMRIGGDRLIPVNVRVIANTNKELSAEILKDSFREDLYFRINVLQINIPPLRDRSEDIAILIEHFIKKLSDQYSLGSIVIPQPFMHKLIEYEWPGNVRQLINFVEQLVLVSQSHFKVDVFENHYQRLKTYSPANQYPVPGERREQKHHLDEQLDDTSGGFRHQIRIKTKEHEAYLLRSALEKTNFNKVKAAALLGISRTTLYNKLDDLKFL